MAAGDMKKMEKGRGGSSSLKRSLGSLIKRSPSKAEQESAAAEVEESMARERGLMAFCQDINTYSDYKDIRMLWEILRPSWIPEGSQPGRQAEEVVEPEKKGHCVAKLFCFKKAP